MNKRNSGSPKAQRLERERKLRRESIIDIARKFFIEHGYDQTMVDKIAAEAGYTKVTIYNYFESKDDLFVAVISRVYENLFNIMDSYLKRPDVESNLRSMGDAYVEFYEQYPDDAILFESNRLSTVIKNIHKKETNSEDLSESELEFRVQRIAIENLMTSVIRETLRNSGIEGKVDSFSVIMVLSTFAQTIRELIIRGKSADNQEGKTNEYLSIFFTIIDKGLKHFDD
ncbi:MAG: TetR/AcrR family transcriptional regulator [Candidatus Thorarchaeota archaeon]